MASKKSGICTYCGRHGSITHDHVPPRALFASPRPSLITVPACDACHRGTTKDDEYFRGMLALRHNAMGHDVEPARDAFIRSLQKPEQLGLRRSFFAGVRDIEIRTPAGLYLGKTASYKVDVKRFDRVMVRIVRGLYRHHLHDRLPAQVHVRAWTEDGLETVASQTRTQIQRYAAAVLAEPEHSIGDGRTFRYRYLIVGGGPYCSLWVLTVYSSTTFFALTIPSEALERRLRLDGRTDFA